MNKIIAKAKYTGKSTLDLENGKIYNILESYPLDELMPDCHRVVDDSEEDYLYSKKYFEIVEVLE